jgi:GNAT superfamily N-acetyltransferase
VDLVRTDSDNRSPGTRTVEYRPGTSADAGQIAELLAFENHRTTDVDELRRLLNTWPSVVAFAAGRLVGAFYSRGFSPDILELRNTIVAAELRGRGIGQELTHRFEAAARARGFRALIGVNCRLHRGATAQSASAARGFWLKMGWSIIFATDGSAVVATNL